MEQKKKSLLHWFVLMSVEIGKLEEAMSAQLAGTRAHVMLSGIDVYGRTLCTERVPPMTQPM